MKRTLIVASLALLGLVMLAQNASAAAQPRPRPPVVIPPPTQNPQPLQSPI